MTYIRTQQGWLYLAFVLDLYSRRVVSWAFLNQPNSELSVRAINLAVQLRQPKQSMLFHTDQGVQCASKAFRQALQPNTSTMR
ncbi:MAG: DDE-type integrase/transposase/recombinase [Methylophilaceae bacterium]|nr:DDE-type integrase/transposase/recombinase [Methylophilaceae bacterium]